ncbi:MAG: helix-turn-helix domain-containing protein [Clostridiales bacterium]|nr:helix-turn-helix domain-containing protein [Clostridiales bacterium]
MTPYLPRTVAIGDKLRLVPYALDKQDNGSGSAPHALTGQVIYIHPRRLFATVRFPLEGWEASGHKVDKGFNEVWPIMPDERRIARRDPAPETGGWHNSKRLARPLAEMLQEREWTGMSQGQIAKELGASPQSVSSAIRALSKRGIEIKHKKGLNFVQVAQARKAAAGSSSPDSGKNK